MEIAGYKVYDTISNKLAQLQFELSQFGESQKLSKTLTHIHM